MKKYYELTKPGIIRGNVITAIAGFLLASRGEFDSWLFLGTIIGLLFVVASACVVNNIIDRDIDAKMMRTKDRALVKQQLSIRAATIFGLLLGILGFSLMFLYSNIVATVLALVGYIAYAGWYTFAKRKTPLSTIIGTVSGATPIVIGYVAVVGQIDVVALVLFSAMVYWQLAHFYAIALYRQKEYEKAHITLWPTGYGRSSTYTQINFAGIFFVASVLLLGYIADLGALYFVGMVFVGFWWLQTIMSGSRTNPQDTWARKVFKQSLVTILVWSILLSVDHLIT